MFCRKTYRKTRWLELVLKFGQPTTDVADAEAEEWGDDLFEEDYYDDEEESPWMIVDSNFNITIKRGRWTPVKYIRQAYSEKNLPYLECKTTPTSRTMKIFKPQNHIGQKNISIMKV